MQNFDIKNLAPSVGWFNVMTYDLHGTWDAGDPWIGNVVAAHTNLTEIDEAMNLLWRNQIDPSKVTMGLGFYGRSFTLSNPSCSSPGCGFSAGGNAGTCTATVGILSYDEIVDIVASGATVTYDTAAAVEIATFGGNQWVSYDDSKSLAAEIKYANQHCLGGTMAWAVDLDKGGNAASALSSSTGLEKRSATSPSLSDPVSQCQWTSCINPDETCVGHGDKDGDCVPGCPDGTTVSTSLMGTQTCPGTNEYRLFCCPNNNRPTCNTAKGTSTASCNGKCNSDQVQVGSDSSGCLTGANAVCCDRSNSLVAQSQCSKWTSTSDFVPRQAVSRLMIILRLDFLPAQ